MLNPAQKVIRGHQGVGSGLRHQPGFSQALQGIHRAARAQLGELAAAHHLQQLHGKFNFANAAARHFYVVGAFGPACTSLGRMLAYLLMQNAQRIKHAVV